MWTKPLVMIVAFVVGLGGSGAAVYTRLTAPKIAYVRMSEVFEKFNMKIELEKKFLQSTDDKQRGLDSLAFDLKMTGNRLESIPNPSQEEIADFNHRQKFFLETRKQLDEEKQ